MYKLYYYPLNASMAPHILLRELDVEFELFYIDRKLNAQNSAEYLKINPTGKIPTLVFNGQPIFESAAICLFLAERHMEKGLIPQINDPQRALAFQWVSYLSSTLQPALMVYFYPERYSLDLTVAKEISRLAELQVTGMLTLIDQELEGRSYLVGNSYTVCDCILFMLLIWADELNKPPLMFKNLSDYLRRLSKRRAIQAVCEIERLSLEPYEISTGCESPVADPK